MKNTTPRNYVRLVSGGMKAVAGLQRYQTDLGIVHNPSTLVLAAVNGLTASADQQRTARRGKKDAFDAQATAVANADVFIPKAVDVLTPYLGRSWNTGWVQAGFIRNLSLPASVPDRLEVLRSLKQYFADHPTHQNATLEVTGPRADALRTALEAAVNTVTRCKADAKGKRRTRVQAEAALRRRLRLVIKELEQVLPEEDTRWNEFGFNAPGDTQAPEPVSGVVVQPGGPGELFVEWPASARAERYLVQVQVLGVDTDFQTVETDYDTDADLENLPPGKQVRVRIVAANDAGESAPSEVVPITVPSLSAVA